MAKKKYPPIKPGYVVNKRHYTVTFTDEIAGRPDVLGECHHEPPIILLKSKQSEKEVFSTLIHELVHVFDFEYDINLTETQVQKLEKAVIRFLNKNQLI
jgi:hypothetical protein